MLNSRDFVVQSAGEGGESAAKRTPDAYKGNRRSSSAAVAFRSTKPAYSGTAGLKKDSSIGPPSKKTQYAGYVSWDESEDEENENNYDSEASSDMEANVFDVDQEEEFSARAATREDAEELARLNEHDRKKRERKMILERLAAEKRNRKRAL